jgi:hypothetical protein
VGWYYPNKKNMKDCQRDDERGAAAAAAEEEEDKYDDEELKSAWESGGSNKALFNHVSEAEKALHYLETMPASTALIQVCLCVSDMCSFVEIK